ncbi:MAG TPA: TIR domain-containing protein [Thermoanaerobaculia bacterium]|nr:TIR domain-containing protein [Thermoanaerobaculia bacterium]
MSTVSQLPVLSASDPSAAAGRQEITLFISYWRPDQPVVMQLAAALEEAGIVAKGDWLLTAGAPFHDVLGDWIVSASTVVLMLTPEFLASAECAKEVERARRLGKRLAPILLRRVPTETMPEELRAINWIVWPQDGNVQRLATLLREGIDKDFDWEREHSRIAERQEQWARSGGKRSFTLRRDDLRRAESWIARAGTNPDLTPRPTPAIIDFVAQSRRDEKTAQRVAFGTIITVLLILLAAGAFALREANARAASERLRAQAEEGRALADRLRLGEAKLKLEAEERKRVAEKFASDQQHEAAQQRIAAAANAETALSEQLRLTEDMGRRLLTEGKTTDAAPYLAAVYAQRVANPPLGETDALRTMLARAVAPLAGRRAVLSEDAKGVSFVAFSADDSQVATATDDGLLSIWETKTGKNVCGAYPDESSFMIGAAFTPDRNRVIAYESHYRGNGDGTDKPYYTLRAYLIDCSTGLSLEHYDSNNQGEHDPAWIGMEPPRFTVDGKSFTFDFTRGEVFSLADGSPRDASGIAPLQSKAPPPVAVDDAAKPCAETVSVTRWASGDGAFVVDPNGMLYRTSDCAWVTQVEGPTAIRTAQFSHDRRLLATAYGDGAVVWEWQKARPALLAQWQTGGVDAVFADRDGKSIVVAQKDRIEVRDVKSGAVVGGTTVPSGRTATLIPLTERVIAEGNKDAELLAARGGAALAQLELDPNAVIREHSEGTAPESWAADVDTKLMMIKYPAQWDDGSRTTFELRDLQTGKQLSSLTALGDDFDALAMNWRKHELFTTSRNGTNPSMWTDTIADHWSPNYIRESGGFIRSAAAAFLPDGQTILTADRDGIARFHASKSRREQIRTRLSDSTSIAISRDGRFALIGNAESTEILDLTHYVSVALCTGRMSGDRWALSADSRLAVTSGPDAMVRVWDLASGRLISSMRVPEVPRPARFSEVGGEILVQAGKLTQLWRVPTEARLPAEISGDIARLLPLRLDGERLVPRK